MANKPPYFPFYPKDFASDSVVEAMTTREVGAYILLLCKAWHESPPGSIPNDDLILARWSRLESAVWEECKPAVLRAFVLTTDNRWHQKRMHKEYAKLSRVYSSKSKGGKKGAAMRWESYGSPIGSAYGKNIGPGSDSDSSELELGRGAGGGKRKRGPPGKFVAPSLEEVKAYCLERGNSVDSEQWLSHYESNGWHVGKNKMRDWQAAVRTWEKTSFSQPKPALKGPRPLTDEECRLGVYNATAGTVTMPDGRTLGGVG